MRYVTTCLVTRSTFLPLVVLVRSLKVLIGSLAVLICSFVYRYPLVVFVCSLGLSDCRPLVLLVCSFFCPLVVLVELSVGIFKTEQWKQRKFNFEKLRVPKLFDYFNEIWWRTIWNYILQKSAVKLWTRIYIYFRVYLRKRTITVLKWIFWSEQLKVQSCKLYKNNYMITSAQMKNNEVFAFITVLVFTLLTHKILFMNRKDNRNC